MANLRGELLLVTLAGLSLSGSATGQALASIDGTQPPGRCDIVEVTRRLRLAHPLGAAARPNDGQCLGDGVVWVPTTPMEDGHRLAWRQAVGALGNSGDPSCRLAASTLVWLEQVGVVSVWAPADTAAGLVYFGSSYASETSAPLAVQFWALAFERPIGWLIGALAHEAFHVLYTDASEASATGFGEACRRTTPTPNPDRATEPNVEGVGAGQRLLDRSMFDDWNRRP